VQSSYTQFANLLFATSQQ